MSSQAIWAVFKNLIHIDSNRTFDFFWISNQIIYCKPLYFISSMLFLNYKFVKKYKREENKNQKLSKPKKLTVYSDDNFIILYFIRKRQRKRLEFIQEKINV